MTHFVADIWSNRNVHILYRFHSFLNYFLLYSSLPDVNYQYEQCSSIFNYTIKFVGGRYTNGVLNILEIWCSSPAHCSAPFEFEKRNVKLHIFHQSKHLPDM